jgi:hypothetical protein
MMTEKRGEVNRKWGEGQESYEARRLVVVMKRINVIYWLWSRWGPGKANKKVEVINHEISNTR